MKASAKRPNKPVTDDLLYARKAMRKAQQNAIKEDILYGLKPVLAEKKASTKKKSSAR